MIRRKLFMAAAVGFMSLLVSSYVFAQADVIEKRQKLMKSNSADAKEINNAAKDKDYATIETKAKEIVGNAGQIVGLFPKGSTKGKTKATAAIWEKHDEFEKNAKNLGKAASELAAAAKAKNDAEVGVKVKALGDVCGSCHDTFRAKKYSE
jgi:cytochrome c556